MVNWWRAESKPLPSPIGCQWGVDVWPEWSRPRHWDLHTYIKGCVALRLPNLAVIVNTNKGCSGSSWPACSSGRCCQTPRRPRPDLPLPRVCGRCTAPPASGSTAPPGERCGSSAGVVSPRGSAAAVPCAPGRPGRAAAAGGTTWASVTRAWCAWTGSPRTTWSKGVSAEKVRAASYCCISTCPG